jgi:hypothetical protein
VLQADRIKKLKGNIVQGLKDDVVTAHMSPACDLLRMHAHEPPQSPGTSRKEKLIKVCHDLEQALKSNIMSLQEEELN